MLFPSYLGPNSGVRSMTQTTFQRIDVETARDLLGRDDTVVLDVRNAADYEKAHISSAQWVSAKNLSEVLSEPPKAAPLRIYCYHGNASQSYARVFTDFGFTNVYSLDGGFERWRQAEAQAAPQRA